MKIAVVSFEEDRYWQSCFWIINGLRAAYTRLSNSGHDVRLFTVSRSLAMLDLSLVADEVGAFRPEWVVFLDTSPIFGTLLAHMTRISALDEANIRFHAFGDYTRLSYLWLSWEKLLLNRKVQWMCASRAQQRLVSSTLLDAEQTDVCPFPVEASNFQFDESLRQASRRVLMVQDDEHVILYAGRMSLQKNPVALLDAWMMLPDEIRNKTRLIFAGEFDDLSGPFKDWKIETGGYFVYWMKHLERLSMSDRRRVFVMRGQGSQALRMLYSAADLFASLSLQHDEDFGMAPAEASIAGLPLVLTDWGGFSDFATHNSSCEYVSVHLASTGPEFDIGEASKKLERALRTPMSASLRRERGLSASATLSIEGVTRLLTERTTSGSARTFLGFNERFRALAGLYNSKSRVLNYPECGEGSIYEQIYRNYV